MGAAPPNEGGEGGARDWISLVTGGAELSLGGDSGFEEYGYPRLFCEDPSEMEPLDLVVTDHFSKPGYYMTELSMRPSSERAPQAVGTALELHWRPVVETWVGLALQNKLGNWEGPGVCVEPGAAKIQLQARGARGGELVHFGALEPEATGVRLENQLLTAEWQTYELDVSGVDYNHTMKHGGVRCGLSIVLANAALGEQWIYVDDIRWVAATGQE